MCRRDTFSGSYRARCELRPGRPPAPLPRRYQTLAVAHSVGVICTALLGTPTCPEHVTPAQVQPPRHQQQQHSGGTGHGGDAPRAECLGRLCRRRWWRGGAGKVERGYDYQAGVVEGAPWLGGEGRTVGRHWRGLEFEGGPVGWRRDRRQILQAGAYIWCLCSMNDGGTGAGLFRCSCDEAKPRRVPS